MTLNIALGNLSERSLCCQRVYGDAAGFNIGPAFAQKYAFLCVHVWMLLVRLRAEGEDGKDLAQMLYENFQEQVEELVRSEGVKVKPLSCLQSAQNSWTVFLCRFFSFW